MRLGRPPLVDASCEIRVRSAIDLHSVIPGMLFTKFEGSIGKVEQVGQFVPDVISDQVPHLNLNTSLVRVQWGTYIVTVGRRNIAVGPRLPGYGGWADFKTRVLLLFEMLLQSPFVDGVDRYSLKYTNIVPAVAMRDQHAKVDWTLTIGAETLKDELTHLRVEFKDEPFTTILQLATGVEVQLSATGERRGGMLIDIDSICAERIPELSKFRAELPDALEAIHLSTKKRFFSCLRPEAIVEMEPAYE